MSREEVQDLLISIQSLYPNWKPDNKTGIVNAWHEQLKDISKEDAETELDRYVKSEKGCFLPNVSALIPKQVYGFTGRVYSDEFFDEIEKESMGVRT